MSTIQFLLLSLLLTIVKGKKPHIIFIVADDLGWNDVGFHGSKQIPTPNIDTLAYDGIILNSYYVQPICSPSRSALMTGYHPIKTGMQHNVIMGPEPFGLPLKFKLLPQYLQDLGYRRHMVGKWHLGFFEKEYTPLFRGFESHFGYWCGHQDYYDHMSEEYTYWGYDMRSNMSVSWDAFGKYTTDLFTNEALKVLEQHNADEPLFLYLPHLATHSANSYSPLQAPEKYKSRFPWITDDNRRTFAGMLAGLDDGVGAVVKKLHEKNMLDDSVIVFTTDNGGPAAGFDMNHASNWPLRGVKATLWEGGVRGSSFLWSTRFKNAPRVFNQLMKIEDWLPTLYAAAGGNVTKLGDIDGLDMWTFLSEDLPTFRREILHNIDDISNVSAIRYGEYKLVQGTKYGKNWNGWYGPSGRSKNDTGNVDVYQLMQRSQSYKAISALKGRKWSLKISQKPAEILCGPQPSQPTCDAQNSPCLFYIPNDPCEYHNLAAKRPDIVQLLLKRIDTYRNVSVKPGNKPSDPRADPSLNGGIWTNWND